MQRLLVQWGGGRGAVGVVGGRAGLLYGGGRPDPTRPGPAGVRSARAGGGGPKMGTTNGPNGYTVPYHKPHVSWSTLTTSPSRYRGCPRKSSPRGGIRRSARFLSRCSATLIVFRLACGSTVLICSNVKCASGCVSGSFLMVVRLR